MTTNTPSASGTIIVGVDDSPASEHAVMWAADEARLQHRTLTVVHAQSTIGSNELAVLAGAGIPPRQVNDHLRDSASRVVERARALAADRLPSGDVDTILAATDPRSLLLDASATASMVVVGSRGHGPVAGLLLGSVSGALVRHSSIPVAVVRPNQGRKGGVLAAADGSEASLVPLEAAYREASLHGVGLTIVHCLWDALYSQVRWTEPDASNPEVREARVMVAESIAGMGEKFPDVAVDVRVTRGAVDACLVDLSESFDLLVVGRPPMTFGQRLLLGGITTSVAEHAHCPVLVVP
ncbi:MAG: universal stress protein [Nocardioides sp.]